MKLTRSEIQTVFNANLSQVSRYKKTAVVDARVAKPGEVIITIIDGIEETHNTATSDQVVVMNLLTNSREMQLLDRSNFDKRYINTDQISDKWKTFEPKGEVDAFVWIGKSATFDAPWGEEMIIMNGDMLCRIPGTEDDIYRIERGSFDATYQLVQEAATEVISADVIISAKDYQDLIDNCNFLNCLRASGVDNWDGYSYAQEMFTEYEQKLDNQLKSVNQIRKKDETR